MNTNVFQDTLAECLSRFGDKTAIEYGLRSTSFHELEKRSNYLANWIVRKGMKKESKIGILSDDRVEVIVLIIGILKAGCIFVPLVSDNPAERLQSMIHEIEIDMIITDSANLQRFKSRDYPTKKGHEFFIIDDIFQEEEPGWFEKPPDIHLTPEDKIYIYFTSGTAGKPKAIVGKNKSLLHFIKWEVETFNIGEQSRTGQLITPAFDAFLRDVFVPLFAGGVLCIPGNVDIIFNSYTLIRWLEKLRINLIHCVPTLFRLLNSKSLDNNSLKTLKFILLSGEKIYPSELVNWYNTIGDRVQLVNFYGPTETTMIKSYYLIQPSDVQRERIPIGKPIRGCRLIILDENMNICDKLVTGEIYIRTPFSTFGYYNDTPSNNEKFIQNPFTDDPDSLLYKTGDLGKVLPDGNIELLGRVDRQVKIRGIRIELEEIENELNRHPSLKQAVVIKAEVSSNNEFLCAFITPAVENEMEMGKLTHEIKTYLAEKLPEYMMPAKIIKINEFPLKPNGKIDYEILHERVVNESGDMVALPTDYIQLKLLDIWSEILERKNIGVNVNFFELGGNSLNIMTLLAKIHREFDVKIPLGEIFNNSSIAMQAKIIKNEYRNKYAAIEAAEKKDYFPLSSAQKRLYILHKLTPGSTAYNIPMTVLLAKKLDLTKIKEAIENLIDRHEGFRTSFAIIDDEPVQLIHKEVAFEIENYDLAAKKAKGHKEGKGDPAWSNFIRPFDLSRASLLRVGLVHNIDGSNILLVDMHHIISDGVSHGIMVKDFLALYKGEELLPLRLQYKDFSQWQRGEEEKKKLKSQEEYWLKEFEGEIPVLELPMDYPRPVEQSFEGNSVDFEITGEETRGLKAMALTGGFTLFMVLEAVVNILLSKLSGQEDIVMGTPIAGRRHVDLENIIGMFVNTLSLRNYPAGNRTFSEFLCDVKERTLKAFENQEYPFEVLVDKLSVNRDIGRNPLFDIMFVLQNMNTGSARRNEETELEISRLVEVDSPKEYENIFQTAKFDLTLTAMERDRGLFLSFSYCTKLFKKETVERFIVYFKKIVSIAAKEPGIKISDIEIISEEEKNRLLYEFNDTAADYPKDKTIHRLFEEQVERAPDHTVLVGAALRGCPVPDESPGLPVQPVQPVQPVRQVQLTYHQLNERSGQLSRLLIEKGTRPDTIVGIMVERSLEMIVGIMGILKSGAAYLPIDPGYPQERIDYMLADSDARIVLTSDAINRVPTPNRLPIHLSTLTSFSTSTCQVSPANLAYIIYTSGTTGKPKGVIIPHHSIVNTLCWRREYYKFNPGETVLQISSFTFDCSVEDIFTPLISGSRLLLIPPDQLLNLNYLGNAITRERVTHFLITPNFYIRFLEEIHHHLKGIKHLAIVGENFVEALVKDHFKKLPGVELYNEYGPTEASVCTTIYGFKPDKTKVLIGKPINNAACFILNKYNQLNPLEVAGELFISGVGVARGYLNNPELTAEKFIEQVTGAGDRCRWENNRKLLRGDEKREAEKLGSWEAGKLGSELRSLSRPHPGTNENQHHRFAQLMGTPRRGAPGRRRQKIYKTGDLARWLSDGNIEFLGRIDHQVKIRGHRIELGEIERTLLSHEKVKNAVVILKTDDRGDKYLCAYVAADNEPGLTETRAFLSGKLPEYMIPAYFIFVDHIPLTPNGKVDRKSLPEPGIQTGNGYIAPRNNLEEKLVEIWSGVLNLEKDKISIDANFFELGGHSLKATIMAARIHKELRVRFTLAHLFTAPTIRKISQSLEEGRKEKYTAIEPTEKKEYYPLSPAQKRFYIMQQMDLQSTAYNLVEIFSLKGKPERNTLVKTFETLVERHENLRTSFELIGGEPVQRVHHPREIKFSVMDYRGSRDEKRIIRDFVKPFHLVEAPLLRVGIIALPGDEHILMVDMHHIISDGASDEILIREFVGLYRGEKLPHLKLRYIDYLTWLSGKEYRQVLKNQETHWLEIYNGEIPVLELPTDYPRPAVHSFAGDMVRFEMGSEQTAQLKEIALEENVTVYMLMLAIFYVLLANLGGQEDIIVGTDVQNRRHADLEGIIGVFVNTLALRNTPKSESPFKVFLKEVKNDTLKAFENQEYPFEELVDRLGVKRDPSRNPLFDVMFALQQATAPPTPGGETSIMEMPGITAIPYDFKTQTAKFDMLLVINDLGDRLSFNLEYCTELFTEETINNFIKHLREIISAVINDTAIKIKDLVISHDLLTAQETIAPVEFGF